MEIYIRNPKISSAHFIHTLARAPTQSNVVQALQQSAESANARLRPEAAAAAAALASTGAIWTSAFSLSLSAAACWTMPEPTRSPGFSNPQIADVGTPAGCRSGLYREAEVQSTRDVGLLARIK